MTPTDEERQAVSAALIEVGERMSDVIVHLCSTSSNPERTAMNAARILDMFADREGMPEDVANMLVGVMGRVLEKVRIL